MQKHYHSSSRILAGPKSQYPQGLSRICAYLICASILSMIGRPASADAGSADNISISMTSNVIQSPIGRSATAHVVKGSLIDYQIAVAGPSLGGSPASSFAFGTPIPAEMELFVGDLDNKGSGPVAFAETDSGLQMSFSGLTSSGDGVEFSNNGGQSFDYAPRADLDGYDNNVTHIRMRLLGTLTPVNGRHARFTVRYRARIK